METAEKARATKNIPIRAIRPPASWFPPIIGAVEAMNVSEKNIPTRERFIQIVSATPNSRNNPVALLRKTLGDAKVSKTGKSCWI